MSIRALGRQFVDQVKNVKRALDEDYDRKMKQAPLEEETMEFK